MCEIVKKYFIYVVCILLGGILCTYALCNSYNWAMKINQTTYRVVIPKIFEEIRMEELKQEKVVVGDKLLFCSSTIEGKMNQKGNYQIYTASIQDNKK